MTDKSLISAILKKYRTDSGYYLLQKAALHIKTAKNKRKMSPLFLKVHESLTKSNYEISPEEAAKCIQSISQPPPDDKELFLFVYYCCKSVFIALLNEPSTPLPMKYRVFLSQIRDFDFDGFYNKYSHVNKILLKNDPDYYKQSDSLTRRHMRRYLYRYAKKHRISEIEAAKIYRGGAASSYKWAFLYFPLLLILSLLICAVCSLITGILPAVFLFLPVFDSLRLISCTILSRTCIPSIIPSIEVESIPDKGRTIAVITTLIEKDGIDSLLEKLEDYHNATKDSNVCLGVLADLGDSGEYLSNKDENHITTLKNKFNKLNQKYNNSLCLFIRNRSYIATEEKFSGKERKRGAVLELCSLLRGGHQEFDTVICPAKFLSSTSYLITLDSDTNVSFNHISCMISAMLHPLNKPVIENGRVIKGHAILQPKMATSLFSSRQTPFTLSMTSDGGNDGYRNVDFELYQTLFSRSTFCGKGIIDISAFNTLLSDRFQEERILSHDTIEGAVLRCGYLSHITLTDSFPKNPLSYYKRYHRWLRGDIQSIPFLFSKVRDAAGNLTPNPLNSDPLGKWLILDNIQRAFLPISIFICMMFGYFINQKSSILLISVALMPILIPFILSFFSISIRSPFRFFSIAIKGFCKSFCKLIFEIAEIPSKFLTSFDAISKALWRMTISKKHLLQWVTAEAGEKISHGAAKYFIRFIFSFTLGIASIVFSRHVYFDFFSILWILFFFICFCLSCPYPTKKEISPTHKNELDGYCLDSWYYFAHLVDRKTNHLPPDNYQISPVRRLATRTSPTNIGLYLLVVAAAHKFGYISKDELKKRLCATLDTLDRLPKYNGHLYNWYDVTTCRPIGTPFISTVDSGNFIASAIALKGILVSPDLKDLNDRLDRIISEMPLSMLYNKEKRLFAIGLDPSNGELTDNCYDILMSEVRTTVYIAVCRHEVDESVWYRMGRPVITQKGYMGLASWSGTGFEYFMPAIFLPVYPSSLQYESLGFALSCQMADKENGIWGRSESGYFEFDHQMNYQYRAFGASALAIDPEISRHNVISPYTSFLTLASSFKHSCANLSKMKKLGLYGKYGFYEAVDYTKSRVGMGNAIIYSWMSHHLSMSILSATNACFNNIIVKSFMADCQMRCGKSLLMEGIPVDLRISKEGVKAKDTSPASEYKLYTGGQTVLSQKDQLPESACYSNSIMSFHANGLGMIKIKYKNYALTNPFFRYPFHLRGFGLRLVIDDKIYSPLNNSYFSSYMTGVIYSKKEGDVLINTSLSLHGELNAVCLNITAEGSFKDITVCPWFEPVLDTEESFEAHSTFSELGVQAYFEPSSRLLIYKRKLRNNPKEAIYLAVGIAGGGHFDFITRRENAFDTVYSSHNMDSIVKKDFDNKTGACISPICAIKKFSSIKNGDHSEKKKTKHYSIDLIIYAAESENELFRTQNKLRHDKNVHTSGYTAAFSKSLEPIAREQLTIAKADKAVIELCSALRSSFALQPYSHRTAQPSHIHNLYRYGISGDIPTVCLRLPQAPDRHVMYILKLFCHANRYMRCLSQPFDLIIMAHFEKDNDNYFKPQKTGLQRTLEGWTGPLTLNQKGGVFLIDPREGNDDPGAICTLCIQLENNCVFATLITKIRSLSHPPIEEIRKLDFKTAIEAGRFDRNCFNIDKGDMAYPLSYCYSSGHFGTLVTQYSLGFTWLGNSRQNRLTPYQGDTLLHMTSEIATLVIDNTHYDLAALSDNVSFTPSQAIYRGCIGGIYYTMKVGIDIKLPFKYISIKTENRNPAPVDFSLLYKVTPALGDKNGCHYSTVYRDGFIIYSNLDKSKMGNMAMLVTENKNNIRIDSGGSHTCHFILGAINLKNDKLLYHISEYCPQKCNFISIEKSYSEYYNKLYSSFNLKSGIPSLDLMFNYFVPYQILSVRLFGRSGFYQSGGAYGYRDQLQDALSLVYNDPDLLKKQLLRCACRQFYQGDVLHWWHDRHYPEQSVFGIRTRCSDDYLWLVYCTAIYVKVSGDKTILDIPLKYIQGEELKEGEQERGMTVTFSDKKEKLYYHCLRALHLAVSRKGENGLCLMGSCDWNDGFSMVGNEGKGTSVFVTRFLQLVLYEFSSIAHKTDKDFCMKEWKALDHAVEETCFNGEYYTRGYYDNGMPLGNFDSDECVIDILPQAFSAIVKGKNPRTESAMKKGISMLFDHENRLLSLFTPPFENSMDNPGYIMSYLPGIRENGGQYNHGAMFAALGCFTLDMNQTGFEILEGVNPAYRTMNKNLAEKYRAEPYALAGDIYTNPQHVGKGGWSQYTGSAGWFYSLILTELLGYGEHGGKYFTLSPHFSPSFNHFSLFINKHNTKYTIEVEESNKDTCILDGQPYNGNFIFDKGEHFLKIKVAKK